MTNPKQTLESLEALLNMTVNQAVNMLERQWWSSWYSLNPCADMDGWYKVDDHYAVYSYSFSPKGSSEDYRIEIGFIPHPSEPPFEERYYDEFDEDYDEDYDDFDIDGWEFDDDGPVVINGREYVVNEATGERILKSTLESFDPTKMYLRHDVPIDYIKYIPLHEKMVNPAEVLDIIQQLSYRGYRLIDSFDVETPLPSFGEGSMVVHEEYLYKCTDKYFYTDKTEYLNIPDLDDGFHGVELYKAGCRYDFESREEMRSRRNKQNKTN